MPEARAGGTIHSTPLLKRAGALVSEKDSDPRVEPGTAGGDRSMGESWAREGAGMQRGKWPKAGAAEGEAGGRKEEKREPTREKEKGPNPEARARGEEGRQRNWGGHMKRSPGS